MPDLRFFAEETAPGSDLQVQAIIGFGRRQIVLPLGSVADGSMPAWGPVAPVILRLHRLPRWVTIPIALRFVVPDGHASWRVDDVYVDPYRLG